MSGYGVRLRVVRSSDLDFLYAISADTGFAGISDAKMPSPGMFRALLWTDVLSQFVIETADGSRILGLVGCRNHKPGDGTGRLFALASPRARGTGLVVGGVALYISHLFAGPHIRKLYVEGSRSQLQAIQLAAGSYLQLEACLKEAVATELGFEDHLIYVLDRADWVTLNEGSAKRGARDEVASLDDFIDLLSAELGTRVGEDDLDSLLSDIGIDSIGAYLALESIGELTQTIVALTEIPEPLTARSLYTLYLEKASSPIKREE